MFFLHFYYSLPYLFHLRYLTNALEVNIPGLFSLPFRESVRLRARGKGEEDGREVSGGWGEHDGRGNCYCYVILDTTTVIGTYSTSGTTCHGNLLYFFLWYRWTKLFDFFCTCGIGFWKMRYEGEESGGDTEIKWVLEDCILRVFKEKWRYYINEIRFFRNYGENYLSNFNKLRCTNGEELFRN